MLRRFILLLTLACALRGGIVIDRIAVIVGKHAVKTSDIQRDLRLTQFLNREPVSLSPAETRKSTERLIDQSLIRDEIVKGGYRAASETEAARVMQHMIVNRFGGSRDRLRETLSRYDLSESELRRQLLWQLTVLKFIDQRFRPGVQVSDEDVRAWYDQHLAQVKREYPHNSSFDAVQSKIRASLEGQGVNQAFDSWLADARKQVRIDYLQGAFQ